MISEVYYKLYLDRNSKVTIVCMQDFDEYDYIQSKFIKNSEGKIHKFESEELAIVKLNGWFKPDEIDPEYLNYNDNYIRD